MKVRGTEFTFDPFLLRLPVHGFTSSFTQRSRMISSRRRFLSTGSLSLCLPLLHGGCIPTAVESAGNAAGPPEADAVESAVNPEATILPDAPLMHIQYLEIVTPDVEASCQLYSAMHGVTFSSPDQDLGNARTARLANGGLLGVRAPMHGGERPVVRPYMLVPDIEATVAAGAKSGAMVAVPPMKLGKHGTCAILIQNGIESGLWQL